MAIFLAYLTANFIGNLINPLAIIAGVGAAHAKRNSFLASFGVAVAIAVVLATILIWLFGRRAWNVIDLISFVAFVTSVLVWWAIARKLLRYLSDANHRKFEDLDARALPGEMPQENFPAAKGQTANAQPYSCLDETTKLATEFASADLMSRDAIAQGVMATGSEMFRQGPFPDGFGGCLQAGEVSMQEYLGLRKVAKAATEKAATLYNNGEDKAQAMSVIAIICDGKAGALSNGSQGQIAYASLEPLIATLQKM